MDYHVNIFWSEEDQGYIADIPDLKGCSAFGLTPEEALHEVQIAKKPGSKLLFLKIYPSLPLAIDRLFTRWAVELIFVQLRPGFNS